jgi:hypothetical protein
MQYTPEQKKYILSKIKMKWDKIPEALKIFWLEYENVKVLKIND